MLKWLILHFCNLKNWFHVKSEWLKNREISTNLLIHNFFLIFGLLGYVHINNSLFEAFVTTDDLGGDWRGSIAVVDDNNITKKIWFGWISGRIQTGMFFFSWCCYFSISLSFGGRLIIIVTRGKRCSVWSSFSILLRLFLRFLEKNK